MRNFLARLLAGLLVSQTASSAICVGKNCELINSAAEEAGFSLNQILAEIDTNIVYPVVNVQRKLVSWEGGLIQFTPRGAENTVKVTLWGAGAWKQVNIDATRLSRYVDFNISRDYYSEINSQSFSYYTGNASLLFGIELPINKNTDLILNGGFWAGPIDYGLGISRENIQETSGRFGIGVRQKIYSVGIADAFVLGGFVFGHRETDMTVAGTKIMIRYSGGSVTWEGEEKYFEKVTYVATPALLGIAFNTPWLTLSAAAGGSVIFQRGNIIMSKRGPVGPYGGYHNIGALSDVDISEIALVPTVTLGAESGVEKGPSVTVSFRPGFNNMPTGGSLGLGWKFLITK